jgi:hypothetical protein
MTGEMRVLRSIGLSGLNVLNARWARGVASIRMLELLTILGVDVPWSCRRGMQRPPTRLRNDRG